MMKSDICPPRYQESVYVKMYQMTCNFKQSIIDNYKHIEKIMKKSV